MFRVYGGECVQDRDEDKGLNNKSSRVFGGGHGLKTHKQELR